MLERSRIGATNQKCTEWLNEIAPLTLEGSPPDEFFRTMDFIRRRQLKEWETENEIEEILKVNF